MIYLNSFNFPDIVKESSNLLNLDKRTCYNTYYPFGILVKNSLERLDFEPVTILYGSNGSGKTTALNLIAEKLNIQRESLFNKSNFYDDYLSICSYKLDTDLPKNSKIITSDDVFDHIINIRYLNSGIDNKREEMFDEYLKLKYSGFQMKDFSDFDKLKKVNSTRKNTQSYFIKKYLGYNIREYSNGENAFLYFEEKFEDNCLILLDEPENSLSPRKRQDMVKLIEQYSRYFSCQFIIATHCPFILSIDGAKIYDLDDNPVSVKKWNELENVRQYYNFFKRHSNDFENF